MRILVTGATGYVGSRPADSDPGWAGGDVLALQRLARAVTPAAAGPALELVNLVPGPVAGVLRTGIDILTDLSPNGKSA